MSIKRVLCPARVRQIPTQFSWIDQRLVRDYLIACCGTDALVLYLFLVTVADAQGLSYYSDQSIVCRLKCLDSTRLAHACMQLQDVGWIAYYESPLYQVLALEGRVSLLQYEMSLNLAWKVTPNSGHVILVDRLRK